MLIGSSSTITIAGSDITRSADEPSNVLATLTGEPNIVRIDST